jgi:hypothetical protein
LDGHIVLFVCEKADIGIIHGQSQKTLSTRAHMAHYAPVPQKGIFAQVFKRQEPMASVALSGKKTVWFEDFELHGHFQPHPFACGRRWRP